MNQKLDQKQPQEKPIDPFSALEKVLRIDRKHSNFDYRDTFLGSFFQVKYPQLQQSISAEHLLKQFWKHIQSFYFKSIDMNQLIRLQYIQSIVEPQPSIQVPFRAEPKFWQLIESTFQQQYLCKYRKSRQQCLYLKNLYYILYGYYRIIYNSNSLPIKLQKEEFNKIEQAKSFFENKQNKKYNESLTKQQKLLKKIIPDPKDKNQVSKQILELEQQLQKVNKSNKKIFNKLKNRVINQINRKQFIYLINSEEDQVNNELQYQENNANSVEKFKDTDLQLKYLEYTIRNLQKKQIAESISKITKYKDKKFEIETQKAMNVKKQLLTEKQLVSLNSLRQYSLLKHYTTSLKSKYTFICHNFPGLQQIYYHRNEPSLLKDKNMLDVMKSTPVKQACEKFEMCHHCKFLYPQNLLTQCKYSSQNLGDPIQTLPYYNPYLIQIQKHEQNFTNTYRKRNIFNNYTKLGNQYFCQRKFCQFCLKNNYDGMDKGLCPFCQGICFCTRCTRNDILAKLKSIYLLLGGNIQQLQTKNQLKTLQSVSNIEQEQEDIKAQAANTIKSFHKLNSIRFSMEDCRILCDLIKRRQKQKQKLMRIKKDCFEKKMEIAGFDFKRPLSKSKSNGDLHTFEKPRKKVCKIA